MNVKRNIHIMNEMIIQKKKKNGIRAASHLTLFKHESQTTDFKNYIMQELRPYHSGNMMLKWHCTDVNAASSCHITISATSFQRHACCDVRSCFRITRNEVVMFSFDIQYNYVYPQV